MHALWVVAVRGAGFSPFFAKRQRAKARTTNSNSVHYFPETLSKPILKRV
jgi:hypothetical protein